MQQEFSAAKRSRLRQAREHRGFSLERLAGRSGYALSTISSVENGHHAPSPRFVSRMAEALGIRIEWLETGSGEMVDSSPHLTRLWVPLLDNYVEHMEETAKFLRDQERDLRVKAGELETHVRGFKDLARFRAARAVASEGVEKHLTNTETSDLIAGNVNAQLPSLLKQLREATAEPGQKTALAKFLAKVSGRPVPLASVSRWLSGEREPGGETVLQMQAWLKRPK